MFENLRILINNILGSDFIIYYENAPQNITESEKEQWLTSGIGVYTISGGSWQLLQGISGCEISTTLSIMIPTEDRARQRVLDQQILDLQSSYNGTIVAMTGTPYKYIINFDIPRTLGDVSDAYGTFRQVKEIGMDIVLYDGLEIGNNFTLTVDGQDLGSVLTWDYNSVNALLARLDINEYALTNFQQNNEFVLSLQALVKDTAIWQTLQQNALTQAKTTYNVQFSANGLTKSMIAVMGRYHQVGSLGSFQVAEMVFAPASVARLTVNFYGNGGEWSTAPSYSVVYNGNGGAGTTIDTNSPYLMGATVTTIANAYTRAGYTFGNWNTKADGSGTAYVVGATFVISDNVTLYAQWLTAVLSVTYDGNGGTTTITDANNYSTGDTVVVQFTPTPTRANYGFAGWATTTTATTPTYTASGATTFAITQDTTLYAVWKPLITITFDGNGGQW